VKLDTVTKLTNAHKGIKVSYIINILFFLHISATLAAIIREVRYKGWIHLYITNVTEPVQRCKIL